MWIPNLIPLIIRLYIRLDLTSLNVKPVPRPTRLAYLANMMIADFLSEVYVVYTRPVLFINYSEIFSMRLFSISLTHATITDKHVTGEKPRAVLKFIWIKMSSSFILFRYIYLSNFYTIYFFLNQDLLNNIINVNSNV